MLLGTAVGSCVGPAPGLKRLRPLLKVTSERRTGPDRERTLLELRRCNRLAAVTWTSASVSGTAWRLDGLERLVPAELRLCSIRRGRRIPRRCDMIGVRVATPLDGSRSSACSDASADVEMAESCKNQFPHTQDFAMSINALLGSSHLMDTPNQTQLCHFRAWRWWLFSAHQQESLRAGNYLRRICFGPSQAGIPFPNSH